MSESTFSSTQDIIDCASSWNLAKDVGLLRYLEQFSEELIGNANKTNENLNSLLTELNDTHVKFNVVKNRFQSLHNTQFIESRVYEDDETLQSHETVKKDDNSTPTSENDKLKVMKNVILKGVEVVDKYFDKVEVPGSDSEDENDFPRFTLRAKDPYSDRPLPYVIGTEEWHKKWHVGLLEETSSESEDEKISHKESSSDSEDTLPVSRPQVLGTSETSSEIDLNKSHVSLPISTSDDLKKDESDKNSFSAQTPIANSTFADQLAAKLGDVFDQNRNIKEPVVNTRPIQKVVAPFKYRNMFPDEEPPPLDNDDDNDLFSSGNVKTKGLFDDLDDNNSLWSNDAINNKSSGKGNKNNNKTVCEDKEENIVNNNKKVLDLFEDDGDDDDDIFNTNPIVKTKKPLLIEQKNVAIPFFSGEPPDINAKKLVEGGSSTIKSDNNLDNETNASSSNISSKENVKNLKETVDIFTDNANDLFDDDDDLFSNIETGKFSSNLFSNISDDETSKNDLKESVSSDITINRPEIPKKSEIETKKELKTSGLSLFDDINDEFDDLFSQDEPKKSEIVEESKNQINKNDKVIFNDIWPVEMNEDNNKDEEKLFSGENITENTEQKPDNNEFEDIKQITTSTNNLFSSTPPELDDDWDVTADNNNLFEDMFEKIPETQPYKLGLFMSDEPPSLFPTLDEQGTTKIENSEVTENTPETRSNDNIISNLPSEEKTKESVPSSPQKLPGKLKHSLNINVKALLPPGARKQTTKTVTDVETPETPKTIENEPQQKQEEKKEDNEKTPQRSADTFKDEVDAIKILDSVTKNRVRAPVQRRPSTRKGRQQYLLSTDSDYTISLPEKSSFPDQKTESETVESKSETIESKTETVEPKTETVESKPETVESKTETVESRQQITVEEISSSKVEQKKPTGRLFDSSDSESDSELFASSSKLKINKLENIQDDSSDIFKNKNAETDDLFKDSISSTSSIKNIAEPKIKPINKDLFGDDTDDDDLFFTPKPKGNKPSDKNQTGAKAKIIKATNRSSIKKLDNEAKPVLDDPLNLLGG